MSAWEDLAINAGVAGIKAAVKDPKKKGKMRDVCLKLARAILTAYPEDAPKIAAEFAASE